MIDEKRDDRAVHVASAFRYRESRAAAALDFNPGRSRVQKGSPTVIAIAEFSTSV
jgi:hypothetical protein